MKAVPALKMTSTPRTKPLIPMSAKQAVENNEKGRRMLFKTKINNLRRSCENFLNEREMILNATEIEPNPYGTENISHGPTKKFLSRPQSKQDLLLMPTASEHKQKTSKTH